MTKNTFGTWWKLFAQRWDKANAPELSAFYFAELHHLNDEQFVYAARRALRKLPFLPTPEELEEFAGVKTSGNALEQWEKVLPLLRNSSSSLASLDEPARRAVRAMGGLATIGQDASAIHFRRSEFEGLYDGFCEHGERPPELTDQSRETLRKIGLG